MHDCAHHLSVLATPATGAVCSVYRGRPQKRLGAFLVHGAADQQKLFTWVQDDWGSLSTRTSGTRVRTGVCGSLSGTQGRRYEKVFSAQLKPLARAIPFSFLLALFLFLIPYNTRAPRVLIAPQHARTRRPLWPACDPERRDHAPLASDGSRARGVARGGRVRRGVCRLGAHHSRCPRRFHHLRAQHQRRRLRRVLQEV